MFAPPGAGARQTLVHPLLFAERLLEVRRDAQGDERQRGATLEQVDVFRGVPSNKREPSLYAASQKQRAEWTRDPRVRVHYRTLRYPNTWPGLPAREKGVDVQLAVTFVKLALAGEYDVLVLCSHDTDLEPALELAQGTGTKVETAGWLGAKRLRPGRSSIWHTGLAGSDFVGCRDRRNYW